jgi:hypothetical protein
MTNTNDDREDHSYSERNIQQTVHSDLSPAQQSQFDDAVPWFFLYLTKLHRLSDLPKDYCQQRI